MVSGSAASSETWAAVLAKSFRVKLEQSEIDFWDEQIKERYPSIGNRQICETIKANIGETKARRPTLDDLVQWLRARVATRPESVRSDTALVIRGDVDDTWDEQIPMATLRTKAIGADTDEQAWHFVCQPSSVDQCIELHGVANRMRPGFKRPGFKRPEIVNVA